MSLGTHIYRAFSISLNLRSVLMSLDISNKLSAETFSANQVNDMPDRTGLLYNILSVLSRGLYNRMRAV